MITDIHCHILYGLDDGAQTLSDTRCMLTTARDIGIDHIVATPHVKYFPYNIEKTHQRYEEIKCLAQKKGIQLDLGFEVHWNTLYSMREEDLHSFCRSETDSMLLEFSYQMTELPQDHEQMIYRVQREGIHIIIAHPERYRFVQKDRAVCDRWKDLGCSLQLDANCLLHNMESGTKRTARRLLKEGRWDYLASDAHCEKDYLLFKKAIEWANEHE